MSHPVYIPSTALIRQIATGVVQVNVANYSLESFDSLLKKLKAGSKGIKVLKFYSQGRSVTARGQPSNETSQGEGIGCDPFGHESYIAAVDHASWVAQHASQRKKVQDLLFEILSDAPITELHIGMRLISSGYTTISAGLKRSKTLRKLSFAGSRMGDAKVALLLGGIIGCQSLKELDLTSCDLSQEAVHTLSVAIKDHMQQRVRMMFAATLRVHLDSSLPPGLARQLYETDLSNARHTVEERCGGIKALHLPYNPKITDNVALSLKDALSMESSLQLLNLQGCGLSLAVEKEFVDLMKEHTSLVRVDLRHGSGRKGHRLGLIRLRPPKVLHQGYEDQQVERDHQEEESVRLQVLLKVVPGRSPDEMEAGHQVPTQTPRSSHCEEASKYNQAQNPWQPMCHNIWTQTGSKAGTKKRGRRSKRGRHRVRCREGLKRGAKGGRQQSAKIKKLLAGGSEMLLRGQQEAANRRQLTQGCKKPAEGRAASRWWDSIWEDPEGQQQRASAEGNRQGLQGDAQCQKEEGALTEVVELLRRLELAVSKKEYAWALNSHPGALDDVQPALRLVPASSQQHGSSDCGRSGTHSIRMEQQPQQGAAFAVENGGHAQGAPFSPSLFALKKAWLGADQALRVCGAATVAPSLPPQTVYQDVFLDSSTQYALPEYQEAPRISSQWTEVPPQTTAPKLPSLTVSLQAAEGCAAVGSAGTEDSTSRYGGREQHSEPSEFLTTLACKSSSASAKGSSREAAVCARLEQLAALCDIFTRARNGAQQTCI